MHLVTVRLHVFSLQDFQSFVVSLVLTLLEAFRLGLSLSLLLQSSIAALIILALSLDVIVLSMHFHHCLLFSLPNECCWSKL